MKVYHYQAQGADGKTYGVRLLLEPGELIGLQLAGVVPSNALEVVGMQSASDQVCAMFEREAMLSNGGTVQ